MAEAQQTLPATGDAPSTEAETPFDPDSVSLMTEADAPDPKLKDAPAETPADKPAEIPPDDLQARVARRKEKAKARETAIAKEAELVARDREIKARETRLEKLAAAEKEIQGGNRFKALADLGLDMEDVVADYMKQAKATPDGPDPAILSQLKAISDRLDARERAEQDREARAQEQAQVSSVTNAKAMVEQHIRAVDTYPHVKAVDGYADVWDTIVEYRRAHGVDLTIPEAAEMAEKFFATQAEKFRSMKTDSKDTAKVPNGTKSKSKTLSRDAENGASSSTVDDLGDSVDPFERAEKLSQRISLLSD